MNRQRTKSLRIIGLATILVTMSWSAHAGERVLCQGSDGHLAIESVDAPGHCEKLCPLGANHTDAPHWEHTDCQDWSLSFLPALRNASDADDTMGMGTLAAPTTVRGPAHLTIRTIGARGTENTSGPHLHTHLRTVTLLI